VRRGLTAAVALGLLLAGAGCGSEGDETASRVTVTVQQTVTEPASIETLRDTIEAEPSAPPTTNPLDGLRTAPNVSTMSVEEVLERATISVPNVVGLDHQLAQDTMQSIGLYDLSEEDATGAGRMLLWDRNWTVVSQDPPPGTMVSPDHTITLRSKKDDE
jgi:hypothetical protein